MKISIPGTTNGIQTLEEAKRYCQAMARVCYAPQSMDELLKEPYKPNLTDKRLIDLGHHSPFDHFNITFYFDGLPKAMAMVFNNQRVCATGEKSARYTVMEDVPEAQKRLYDGWMGILTPAIVSILPETKDRDSKAQKLAQENARYMTSVFTPTKMAHTISLRQASIEINWFKGFVEKHMEDSDLFKRSLAQSMQEFLEAEHFMRWYDERLKMKGGLDMNLFGNPVQEVFSKDIYAVNVEQSMASIAQAHRHRTIDYHFFDGWQLGAPLGFFVPPIVQHIGKEREWIRDLEFVAETDFPQGQILGVAERGNIEYLAMKSDERICGLAQLETTLVTRDILETGAMFVPGLKNLTEPYCTREGKGCKKEGCNFGPKHVFGRLV